MQGVILFHSVGVEVKKTDDFNTVLKLLSHTILIKAYFMFLVNTYIAITQCVPFKFENH